MSSILWTFLKLLLLLTGVYLYNLMTELYFEHEIAISFRNVMLKRKIILKIVFSCEVTIHKFSTNTIFEHVFWDTFHVVVMHFCQPIVPSHPILWHPFHTGYIFWCKHANWAVVYVPVILLYCCLKYVHAYCTLSRAGYILFWLLLLIVSKNTRVSQVTPCVVCCWFFFQ